MSQLENLHIFGEEKVKCLGYNCKRDRYDNKILLCYKCQRQLRDLFQKAYTKKIDDIGMENFKKNQKGIVDEITFDVMVEITGIDPPKLKKIIVTQTSKS